MTNNTMIKMSALLAATLWIAGCGATQAQTHNTAETTAATASFTKGAGPATAAKTPCANCDKGDCAGCDKTAASTKKPCGAACSKPCCAGATEPVGFKLMTAEALKDRLAAAPQVHVYDVNSDKRWAAGHVPGAKHVLRENLNASNLPTNKAAMVVFYCGSSKCRASHKAAKIAVGLGHTNVWVMSDGIKGWETKGLDTAK
jgi:rhodanese-related sulfurtransferase